MPVSFEVVRLRECSLEHDSASGRWVEVRGEERRQISAARAVRLLAGVAGLAAALHVGPVAAYSSSSTTR